MTGYYLAAYGPIGYILIALVTAKFVGGPIFRAMDLDYDRSDTDEFVMAGLFILIAAMLWPLTLIGWWALPKRSEVESQ
ncbi:hypothetical protein AB0A69_07585 [Streptomyces sp. NPDC045431]|uniref:hypothetical protein n=1 Tax=Streptomyces sp. NPDC045431 TaxID=3155613 RepID=UPI0034000D7B